MRLFLLTGLTMVAFAANSILNRLALVADGSDPIAFGALRLAAGAVTLLALLALRGRLRWSGAGRATGTLSLGLYIFGFSWAYLALDAGLGALLLFGTVQVTMFAGALLKSESIPAQRWLGASIALVGLAWLLLPGEGGASSLPHGLSMVAAGIGWGVYSLAGRGATDPLRETGLNFALAALLGIGLWIVLGAGALTGRGVALAVLSGAVTSGLGYALWYSLLPRLAASVAAVAQLTVPVIAILGGVLLLQETVDSRLLAASALVLGGVGISIFRWNRA